MGVLNDSFWAIEMPLFGILNANNRKKKAKFWRFEYQKCFMKLF